MIAADVCDFPAETFDAVIAQSLLVFCDKRAAFAEIHRVLKPGGFLGANELTFLSCPPPEWRAWLAAAYSGLALEPLPGDQWFDLFEQAGFSDVSATISELKPPPELVNHPQAGGWRKYLPASSIRRAYPSYVGCGSYVGRKPAIKSVIAKRPLYDNRRQMLSDLFA